MASIARPHVNSITVTMLLFVASGYGGGLTNAIIGGSLSHSFVFCVLTISQLHSTTFACASFVDDM